jgi:hypothetical protein
VRPKKSSSPPRRRRPVTSLSGAAKKSAGRGSLLADEKAAALAELERLQRREKSALIRKFSDRENKFRAAIKVFRPRKSERGKIVFIGVKGGRDAGAKGRKGYAVYITKGGKKKPIRQLKGGRLATPAARQLSSIDVSRVRNKAAKKQFLIAKANKIAAGAIKNVPTTAKVRDAKKRIIPAGGTIYSGAIPARSFYSGSAAVDEMAQRLKTALNSQRSKKTFLVTVGLVVKTADGQLRFFSTQRRINRQDYQRADAADLKQFFGREVYAFLAREMSAAGLVTTGSAAHIARLKQNKGKARSKWTKGGFLWQGHDHQDATVVKVEYRFDQLTFEK